jgi:hypothetical protein
MVWLLTPASFGSSGGLQKTSNYGLVVHSALSLYKLTLLQTDESTAGSFPLKFKQNFLVSRPYGHRWGLLNPGYVWQRWLSFCNTLLSLFRLQASVFVLCRTELAGFAAALS